jgi:small redox-active disulfide protein 2
MMKIQVLGTGCSKCETLAANALRAVREEGVEAEVVKVREIAEMLEFDGVLALPALAIDGVVKACGRSLGPDEIRKLIAQAGDGPTSQERS